MWIAIEGTVEDSRLEICEGLRAQNSRRRDESRFTARKNIRQRARAVFDIIPLSVIYLRVETKDDNNNITAGS